MTPYSFPSDNVANHPLDAFKDEWHLSQQSVHSGKLIVLHDRQPPDEIGCCFMSHHVLSLQISHGSRQITRMDGQEHDGTFPTGNLFLQPANCPASFTWETTDEAMVFILAPDFLSRVATQTECLNTNRLELRPILLKPDPQIEQFAHAFRHEMQTGGLGGQLYSDSLANCLAIHLLRHYCTTSAQLPHYTSGLSRERLRRALDFIHTSLDQPLRLETMATELGLSVYYFSRLFRQSMGVTPYQYVLQQRIEKARRLLQNSDLSIAEIAMDCGFANPSHLARHFRKFVGVSPKIYRQQVQ
ncbi:MAG: AraC family transcriptional regulator [Cyanobacteria bacterium P01_C01_bin.70]